MKIIDVNDRASINLASSTLLSGGIVIFPTDTVYGLGCILDEAAINKLYKIKNRPLNQPTAILLTRNLYHKIRWSVKSGMVERAAMAEKIEKVWKRYPKGKVTLVALADFFKIKFPKTLLKDGKIGFRLPDEPYLETLIERVGPIVASSANKRGKPAPNKFIEIDPQIIREADLTLRTDKILSGRPSAVCDIQENTIIRA